MRRNYDRLYQLFDSFEKAFNKILNSNNLSSSNIYIYQRDKQYCIASPRNRFIKDGWNKLMSKSVALAKHKLELNGYLKKYELNFKPDFIEIKKEHYVQTVPTNKKRTISIITSKDIVRNDTYDIQRFLQCKIKLDLYSGNDIYIGYLYPDRKVDGYFFNFYKRTHLLREIEEFAKDSGIDIEDTSDEEMFYESNDELRKKISWNEYLFSHHIGVAYIINHIGGFPPGAGDRYICKASYGSTCYRDESNKYEIDENNFLVFNFEEKEIEIWKEYCNKNFIRWKKIKEIKLENYRERERDSDHPTLGNEIPYNDDVDADQQSMDYWNQF